VIRYVLVDMLKVHRRVGRPGPVSSVVPLGGCSTLVGRATSYSISALRRAAGKCWSIGHAHICLYKQMDSRRRVHDTTLRAPKTLQPLRTPRCTWLLSYPPTHGFLTCRPDRPGRRSPYTGNYFLFCLGAGLPAQCSCTNLSTSGMDPSSWAKPRSLQALSRSPCFKRSNALVRSA
jgi:hypothetical protein